MNLYDSYDQLVVKCLPEYYALLNIVVQAIGSVNSIVDLGCGTGNLARLIFQNIPLATIWGVDTSTDFLAIARKKCHGFDFRPILTNVLDYSLGQSNQECIVSSFTIHHFDDCEKKKLFSNIHQALKTDGIFINLDMVRPKNYQQSVFDFLARMKENALSTEFIDAEKKEMAERDRPVEISTQKEWLERIGFKFEPLQDTGLFAIYRCKKLSD